MQRKHTEKRFFNYRFRLSGFLAAAVLLLNSGITHAASYTWQVSSGDWSTASNWGGTEPTSSDLAYVNNGGTVTITQTGEACSYLYLGSLLSHQGFSFCK
jgi:hypothetical protein